MEPSLSQAIFKKGSRLQNDIELLKLSWKNALSLSPNTSPAQFRLIPGSRPRNSSPLHVYYSFLFHSAFPEIAEETVRDLAMADRLCLEHLLIYDNILDKPGTPPPARLFLAHLEYYRGLRILHRIFPPPHDFWEYFSQCYAETWRSVRQERLRHSLRIAPYSYPCFHALAKGKTALLKPFAVALVFLSQGAKDRDWLIKSLDQHHTGLVLIDDLEDWKEDYLQGNFTFLLTRLIRNNGLVDKISKGVPVPLTQIGRLLYGTGLAEAQLRLAEACFLRASLITEHHGVPLWRSFNQDFKRRCQALRRDLAEIRRRDLIQSKKTQRATPSTSRSPASSSLRQGALSQVFSAIAFMARQQLPGGGYPLARSPHTYMTPSTLLPVSRMVTCLVFRALRPMHNLHPRLGSLCKRASSALSGPPETRKVSVLPTSLELAFSHENRSRGQLLFLDRSFSPGSTPLANGLFWANLLVQAAEKEVYLPRIQAFVNQCVLETSYAPWTRGASFGTVASPWTRSAARPLLPLLLFCQALGPRLPVKSLHDYLLEEISTKSSWGNITETALVLICLLTTGYQGKETASAMEHILNTQEPDGSWSPNAVYSENEHYYGSRELTTSWCLSALFLCFLGFPGHHRRSGNTPPPSELNTPRVFLHPGLPARALRIAQEEVKTCQRLLPLATPPQIYLGQWAGMPPHFIIPDRTGTPVAVNLMNPVAPPFLSTHGRLFELEIVLALTAAALNRIRGKIRKRIEHVYAAGLALWTLREIHPDQPLWEQLGMSRLDYLWCREHEAFIWQEMKPLLGSLVPMTTTFSWLQPEPWPMPDGPLPAGASLYLGLQFYQASRQNSLSRNLAADLHKGAGKLQKELASYCSHLCP